MGWWGALYGVGCYIVGLAYATFVMKHGGWRLHR